MGQLSTNALFLEQAHQIPSVTFLLERLSQRFELIALFPAKAPSNLFQAGDIRDLAVIERSYELAGFEQVLIDTGVQTAVAALHDLHVVLIAVQIGLADGCDLQHDAHHLLFVKIYRPVTA